MASTARITRAEAVNVIKKQTRGAFFSVTWVKKSGEVRTILARTGCRNKTKGGKNTVHEHPNYMTLFSVKDGNFRNVDVNRVLQLRYRGQVMEVV